MVNNTRMLLWAGFLIPVIFWVGTVIAGGLHGNYNHFRDTVSQLGAIGAASEQFMTFATWLCVALSIAFCMGLFKACRQSGLNRAPILGVLGFGIMFGWAATFHSGNGMHSKSGPVLLLLLAGPLLSALLWKGRGFRKIRQVSVISFILMLCILLRVALPATITDNYTGLIQRFVHVGWSLWFVCLSLCFLTSTNKSQFGG